MKMLTSATQFLHGVRVELSKVVWPSKQEFIGSTVVVLFLVFVFAVYLGVLDAALYWVATHVLKIVVGR